MLSNKPVLRFECSSAGRIFRSLNGWMTGRQSEHVSNFLRFHTFHCESELHRCNVEVDQLSRELPLGRIETGFSLGIIDSMNSIPERQVRNL